MHNKIYVFRFIKMIYNLEQMGQMLMHLHEEVVDPMAKF
jgi:hypothetical protein